MFVYIKENYIRMNTITLAQREALDVVKDMINRSNTNVPEFGTKIMTLILGILNVDCRVEHVAPTLTDNPDNTLPIDYDGLREGNDKLNMPDWLKNMPTPPFVPKDISHPDPCPFPPQVWYTHETDPIQTNTADSVRYVTEVTCTEDKNCITTTYDPVAAQYTGDFRDMQTSFNDK